MSVAFQHVLAAIAANGGCFAGSIASLALLLTLTLSLIIPSSVLAARSSTLPQVSKATVGRAANAEPGQAGSASAARTQQSDQDRADRRINLAQPDYTVINLPTTLRLPRLKGAFRVTHRFGRPLGQGTFGNLVGDLFGIDSGAQIGLEYRYGIMRGTQIGIYRTSDKTIEFFGQYDAVRQSGRSPVTVDLLARVEGINNFRNDYSVTLGAIISRTISDRAALYVEPIWVGNSNLFEPDVSHDNTFMVGLGARLRVRQTVYLVGAWTPRAAWYRPGSSQKTFGIEKRVGGHSFQLNFSNSLGTTMGQIARGAGSNDDWYLGFNISRKFF